MSFGSLKSYAFYFCGDGNPYINGDIVTPVKGGSRTTPGKVGAAFSRLINYLNPSHYDVSLTEEEYQRITLWLDLNSMELGADYRVNDQKNGTLVWPRIDLDPSNPQGVELDRPLPGSVSVLRDKEIQRIKLFRDGSSLSLTDPERTFCALSLFDISGRLVKKWNFNDEVNSIRLDMKANNITKGVYIFKPEYSGSSASGNTVNTSVKFIVH